MPVLLRFDGGSNPNPGKCAGAYVIYRDGDTIAEGGEFIAHGTNNIGEYTGLISGLQRCIDMGLCNHDVQVEGDSLLVISQVTKKWKVKQDHLMVLCDKACQLVTQFSRIQFRHIRREFNSRADALSDKTLDLKKNWSS
jgi:ribonuclease HI